MMFARRVAWVGRCALAASVLTASPPPVESSPPHLATFVATDRDFDGPDTIQAGQTTIRLRNNGENPHQLQLLKLEDGKSSADLASFIREGGRSMPAWAKHMGGPNGVRAGNESEATIYLEPGTYAVMCMIPGENRLPHAALGMLKALHVRGQDGERLPFHGQYHMAMFDYEFVVVQPLRQGRHMFYVVNRGTQPHQVSLVRLNAGVSTADVLAALRPGSLQAIPGQLLGGMSGLEPGGEGTFPVDLSPGRYAMICLFPDSATQDSHAVKGMVMDFTIDEPR